ncbi:hypothetical protein ACFL6B_00055 [Thermodesulfobacteriota bacterium]
MMSSFAQVIDWINIPANILAKILLIPIAFLPGWFSNTIISAMTGVVLLVIFKYTSNQRSIGRVRDNIKANILALKLFNESMVVTFQAQGRILKGALLLLVHAIRPMLIMIVPVSLLLGQMGLWYQYRPLKPGDETLITMKFNGEIDSPWPKVSVQTVPAIEIELPPVRVFSERELYWKIRILENGYHHIVFQVDKQKLEKQIAIGDGFMRVSTMRPGWHWADILLHPGEKPFPPDAIVQSISINYPHRISRTSGTDWWLIYFFVVSLVFALILRPFLRVEI